MPVWLTDSGLWESPVPGLMLSCCIRCFQLGLLLASPPPPKHSKRMGTLIWLRLQNYQSNPLHFSVCRSTRWTRVLFRVLQLNPRNDSNLLLSSVKMETFVQLFLWGKTEFWEGDFRRSWLLGKRLNYRLDLTGCVLNNADILCWYWLFYLVALCSEVFSFFFFFFPPSLKSVGCYGNSVVLGLGGALSTNVG